MVGLARIAAFAATTLLLAGIAPALARTHAPGAAAQPVAGASAMPANVRTVLERARREYAAASSYRDRAEITFDLRGKDSAGDLVEQSTTNGIEFLFQRPGRFVVRTDELQIISDGTNLWAIMEHIGQYTQSPVPADLIGATNDPILSLVHQHRPALVLLSPPVAAADAGVERFFRAGTTFERAIPETRKGKPGVRIRGITDPAMPGMGASPYSAWFSDQTGLLEEIRIDLTKTFGDMLVGAPGQDVPGTPRTVDKAELLYVFSDIRVNQPVPASAFSYKAPSSMRKVQSFELGAPGGGLQLGLIGQMAPVFAGQTLGGDEVALDALRGKVVVLDFWATWCAPCIATIPAVQRVAERFAGRNVVVIGINQDRAGSEEKVREFLSARNISFRQILDFEGELGGAYSVSAIPCTVIIDPRGVIQDIDLGGHQNLEESLTDRIETVLRGESIHSEEALARFAQGADDRQIVDDDTGPSAPPTGPVDINPQLLAEGERTQGISAAAIGTRVVDTNGDGRAEYIAPDYSSGGLVVLSPDGNTVEKIRLRGAARGFIGYAAPAQLAGPRGWLIAAAEGFTEAPSAVVRYHDSEGELAWSFMIPTPPGIGAQIPFVEAADLDGDSRTEVIVLAMLAPRAATANPAGSKAWLFILDSAGNTLAARQVGTIATGAFITTPGTSDLRTIVVMADNAVKRFTFDNRKR